MRPCGRRCICHARAALSLRQGKVTADATPPQPNTPQAFHASNASYRYKPRHASRTPATCNAPPPCLRALPTRVCSRRRSPSRAARTCDLVRAAAGTTRPGPRRPRQRLLPPAAAARPRCYCWRWWSMPWCSCLRACRCLTRICCWQLLAVAKLHSCKVGRWNATHRHFVMIHPSLICRGESHQLMTVMWLCESATHLIR